MWGLTKVAFACFGGQTISEFSEWRELSVPRINYFNLGKLMLVSLVFDLLRVSMTSFYLLRIKDCHLKNYVTCGLVEWCSLQIFMACKWLEQQITDVCSTIYVMFDNIKAVKRNWKIMTVILTMTLFKYVPNPQNHMTGNEMRNKPDIQRLQMQFSNVSVSTLCSVEVI